MAAPFYSWGERLDGGGESSDSLSTSEETFDLEDEEPELQTNKRVRSSCDICTARKVKCDGRTPRCSNCVRKGQQCNYSIKKKSGPKAKASGPRNDSGGFLGGMMVPWYSTHPGGGLRPVPHTHGFPSGGLMPGVGSGGPLLYDAHERIFSAHALVPSSQPVGSLFGTEQASFLDAFFSQLNSFLPVTDEPMVRNALLRLLSGGQMPLQALAPRSEALLPHATEVMADMQLQNAQSAILWGAVAIGALLCQQWHVQPYASLAYLSFKECFDAPSPQAISAALVLSLLFKLLNEPLRHRRFLRMATDMAQSLEEETGTPLPAETLSVIRFIRLQVACETGMTDELWEESMGLEAPGASARMRLLYHMGRAMAMTIRNKEMNQSAAEKGLPAVDLDCAAVTNELAVADRLLSEQPYAHSAAGVMFVRGFYMSMKFFIVTDLTKILPLTEPVLEAVARAPALMRLHPGWHIVHSVGLLFRAGGRPEEYETLRQAQAHVSSIPSGTSSGSKASSACGTGCHPTALPPLTHPLSRDSCSHALCQAMLCYTQPYIEQYEGPSCTAEALEQQQQHYQHHHMGDGGETPLLSDDDADFLAGLIAEQSGVDDLLLPPPQRHGGDAVSVMRGIDATV